MKDLRIQIKKKNLHNSTYRISRSNNAYSFFTCEFRNLPKNVSGDIIVPKEDHEEKQKRALELLMNIRKITVKQKDKSVLVPKGTETYTYFHTEYPHQLSEDVSNNIIVPEDLCHLKR